MTVTQAPQAHTQPTRTTSSHRPWWRITFPLPLRAAVLVLASSLVPAARPMLADTPGRVPVQRLSAAMRPQVGPTRIFPPGTRLPAAPLLRKPSPIVEKKMQAAYSKLPLSFEANKGQTDKEVRFLSRGNGYTLFLTLTEAVLALSHPAAWKDSRKDRVLTDKSQAPTKLAASTKPVARSKAAVLRLKLLGARSTPHISGVDEQGCKVNYFIGNDPQQWRTGVTRYAKVRYGGVYRGIDMIYYGNQGQLEYDFIVAPGADPRKIRLGIEGAQRVEINRQGQLVLHTAGGKVVQHAPVVYQEIKGQRRRVAGHYVLEPNGTRPPAGTTQAAGAGSQRLQRQLPGQEEQREVGFRVGGYDRSRPLIIDPVLSLAYSTYLGGNSTDVSNGIAVDSSGNAYVTGYTDSTDFPTRNGYQSDQINSRDAFVAKLNPKAVGDASLLYSTYLGGNGLDQGLGIAVDSSGQAYVIGQTDSTNFPTRNGYAGDQTGTDVFVTKLNTNVVGTTPVDASLLYSTYLGGSGLDIGTSIAVDSSGNAYVTGVTASTNFPTRNGYAGDQTGNDVFVTKLNTNVVGTTPVDASLLYSTYLGGGGTDQGLGIAVDSSGQAYVTGNTTSTDFPTRNGYQGDTGDNNYDNFVTRLNPNAVGDASLLYSTYLGGSGGIESSNGIAVDSSGNAYVTGYTNSTDFPTRNGYQGNQNFEDAFVTKLNTNAVGNASLLYSTYLGGSDGEFGFGIAVDGSGHAYVIGNTASTDFPTRNGYQGPQTDSDVFVTKLNPNAVGDASLLYSTYLGGNDFDSGNGIAVDSSGNAYITGHTSSTNLPTRNGYHGDQIGRDGFVTKLSFGPVWSARDVAVDYSGTTRVLWKNSSTDEVSVWTLNASGSIVRQANFGPYPGWSVQDIAAGANDTYRLLWQHSSGAVALWTVATDAPGGKAHDVHTGVSSMQYGPYAGWSASRLAVGGDNNTRLLWQNSNGTAAVWTIATTGAVSSVQYGPYSSWSAMDIGVGADNLTRVLWRTNGSLALWTIGAAGSINSRQYGPYAEWIPERLSVGADNKARVLWQRSNGSLGLWLVDTSGATPSYQATSSQYGPYANWLPLDVGAGSGSESQLLWQNSNGQVGWWRVDAAGTLVYSQLYGPY